MLSKEAKLRQDYETYGQKVAVLPALTVTDYILHRPNMQAIRSGEMAFDCPFVSGDTVQTVVDGQKYILADVQDELYQDVIVKKLMTLIMCNVTGNIFSISSSRDVVSLMEEETPVPKQVGVNLLLTSQRDDTQVWIRGLSFPIYEGECFISSGVSVSVDDRIEIDGSKYVVESVSARFSGANAVKLGEDNR